MNIEKELLNTQARLNIASKVIQELAYMLCQTQPDYIRDQASSLMNAWFSSERKYPMYADNNTIETNQ